MLGNNRAFNTVKHIGAGSSVPSLVGQRFHFVDEALYVPEREQYGIANKIILEGDSILIADGQIVVF